MSYPSDWFPLPGPLSALSSSFKRIELSSSIKNNSVGSLTSTDATSSSSGKSLIQTPKKEYHDEEDNDELSSMISSNNNDEEGYSYHSQAKIYLDIYRYENIGILVSYFLVGFAMYFAATPLHFYLISTQNASSAQIGALISVQSLPWSMKIFYGLLSDSVPIFRYRRKPYVFLGWLSYALINFILSMLSKPGVRTCIIGAFFLSSSLLLADVATDALSVERSKLESDTRKGSLQTTGYTCRAMGMVFGALLGSVLYNKDAWGWGLTIAQVLLINGLIPGILILIYGVPMVELSFSIQMPSLHTQIQDIWKMLKLRAIGQPLGYLFLYNMMQVPNASWTNFLVKGLKFSEFDLGLLSLSSAVMTMVGLSMYKVWCFHTSFRSIYVITTVLGSVFSLLQLVLVYRWNQRLGMPDTVFALGDNTFMQFASALQMMPACIMFVVLCPEGSEGTTYALLTTVMNLSQTMATNLGTYLTGVWDTSNAAIAAGGYSGVAHLTVLTSVLHLLPILFISILPASKEEQLALREKGESSLYKGAILVAVVVVSLAFTVSMNLYVIFRE